MDNSITYTNNNGEVLRFGANETLHYQAHNLRDYAWTAHDRNGRIASFSREIVTEKKLPVVITADTEAQGVAIRNRICDVCERDIEATRPGLLTVGDYSMRAYVVESKKSEYNFSDRIMELELTIVTDNPEWVRSQSFRYLPEMVSTDYRYLDFPIGYNYDLCPNRTSKMIDNTSRTSSNFTMTIYGHAVNPYVLIGSNRYQVSCTVGDGGYLVIDSRAQTCLIRSVDGTVSNVFAKRVKGRPGSGSYLFERVKPGISEISWDNSFGFDLIVDDARSEPLWT